MKTKRLLLLAISNWMLLLSCSNPSNDAANNSHNCYMREFGLAPNGDTINKIDCNGFKQGHWINSHFAVPDGQRNASWVKVEEGEYKDNNKQGYWKRYNPEGDIIDSIRYKNDIPG